MNKKIKFISALALCASALTSVSCDKRNNPSPSPSPEKVEAVDLGLSVKWASCNVGAENEGDAGSYFAWAETAVKSNYDWSKEGEYKWGVYKELSSPTFGMTKYTGPSKGCDNLITMQPDDDPAIHNLGDGWRTPTLAEFEELMDKSNCEWSWDRAKKGYRVTSLKTGKSIFLPTSGYRYGTDVSSVGIFGFYWAADVNDEKPSMAKCLYILDFGPSLVSNDRSWGFPIRAVRSK